MTKKKTVRALAALAAMGLMLAGCSDGEVKPVGASPTTATTEPAVTPSGPLGGYQPVPDVAQHARVSLDVCEINRLLDAQPVDFAAVAAVYRNGKFSDEKEGVKRTLGKFAGEARSSEDTLGRYERYLGKGWLNAFVGDAIDGIGAFAGAPEPVRREAVRIGVRDQIMVAWALHELDAALDKGVKGKFTKASGAPHNWDEAWAYYHGEKPECSPFATASARGDEFGVGTLVTRRLGVFMRDGQKLLLGKSTLGVEAHRDEVVRNIIISYVQSVMKAASGVDAALTQGKADQARIHQAEGWAYYRVIEPLIAKGNTTSARTVAGIFDLSSKPAAGSLAKAKAAFDGAYGPLGISPADVGELRGAGDAPQAETPEAPGAEDGEPDDGEPEDGE
ncbi:MAG TPA: FEA1-related lipoprotein [Acidimicrobiia bacterium]|nr:FEA1-related lipoprotein [Acidimicrobiia bacterium]